METGGLLASPWPWCSLTTGVLFSIHKGLIWLLVATIAEAMPAVSGWFHVAVLSTHP